MSAAAWNLVHVITELELGGAQLATLAEVSRSRFPNRRRFLLSGPGGLLAAEARRLPGVVWLEIDALQRAIDPRGDLRALVELVVTLRALRRARPGESWLVHTHSSKAGILGRIAARLAGADRVVHSIHGFGHQPTQGRGRYLGLRAAEEMVAHLTDAFTGDSEANLTQAKREGILAVALPHRVVRCGIDVASFATPRTDPRATRAALGIPEDHRVVLSVGCLKPQKDPLTFVRLAARVITERPETTFLLAGDGALRSAVEGLAAQLRLGERFRLLGWRRDVVDLLHTSDLFVLSSLWEGLPQVFAQAMAAKRAIVATHVDGAAEAVHDGESGLLVAPGDLNALMRAVSGLLAEPARCREMGERGFAMVQAFSEERMLHDLDALYAEVVAAPRRHLPIDSLLAARQLAAALGFAGRG